MTDPVIPKAPVTYGLYRFLPPSVYGPAPQNPAPFDLRGQIDKDRVKSLADQIVQVFLNSLPSNYVSQTKGPYYVQQFQAAAEELARIQVLLADAYEDSDYDFTRTEVLFQFLATLVFPDAGKDGLPQVDGDLTYRQFLKRMVALLLQGSTEVTLVSGIEALTDATVTILEKVKHLADKGTAYTLADQFTFEVFVEKIARTLATTALSVTTHYHPVTVNALGVGTAGAPVYASGSGPDHAHSIVDFVVVDSNGTGQALHTHDLLSQFPDLPIVLQKNVALVLQALDPAATLYEYRNLFRENLRGLVTDQLTQFDLEANYYEDFRHDCTGVKAITGTNGLVGADPYLFHDPSLSFRSVRVGAELVIPVVPTPLPASHLPRENRYRVTAVAVFPFGDDPEPRFYTTSPSGLTGYAVVLNGAFVDTTQDFAGCAAGETLTMATGPNAGTYLLDAITGDNGGPLGTTTAPFGPSTGVMPVPSYLRVVPRILTPGTAIPYTVSIDRLGCRVPQLVVSEDVSSYFFGPGASDTFFTRFGPLVKSWGDGTPAEIADIEVSYDFGPPIPVTAVNPFTGEVTLAFAFPPWAPGDHTMTVTYRWFQTPVEGLRGLNTKGLTLNKWNLRNGRNTTSPTSGGLYGGFYQSRFQMGVVLGRFARRKPTLRIAHRFIGFEKGYTAATNSPTTLLLNQAPGRTSVPYATAKVEPQSFRYEGGAFPVDPWEDVGFVQGSVNDSLYTLADTFPTDVAYWKRDFPLPTSAAVSMAARLQLNTSDPDGVFTGVGFGFHNNQRLFFAGALKVPNPLTGEVLRHLGLLLRPGELSDAASWTVGPFAAGQVQKPEMGATEGVVAIPTSSLPTLLSVGDKFQILEGTQTGVYTVTDLFQSRTGKTFLVVTPQFPADPALYGNRDVTLRFDTAWDEGLCTWRLYANTRSQTATVVFGGRSGSTMSLTSGILASPAYLGPDILPEGYGRSLWGSIDRLATNNTTWDFVRCASTPDGAYTYSRGTILDTKWATGTLVVRGPVGGEAFTIDTSGAPLLGPSVLFVAGVDFAVGATDTITAANIAAAVNASILSPNYLSASSRGEVVTIQTSTSGSPGNNIVFLTTAPAQLVVSGPLFGSTSSDPENSDWYLATPFGDTYATPLSRIRVTSTPANEELGTYYGYGYTDPFLNGRRVTALDAKVLVERDTAGVGGASLVLRDTHKEVRLASLRWEDLGPLLGKRIFRTDVVSLVGSVPYWVQGWDGLAGDFAYANGPETILTGDGLVPWAVTKTLVPYYAPDVGRFMEFRVSVEDYTLGTGDRIGLSFAGAFGPIPNAVYVDFRTIAGVDTIVLAATASGAVVASTPVPWSDGNARTYLVVHSVFGGVIYAYVDGVLLITTPLAGFLPSGLVGSVQVQTDAVPGGTFRAYLRSLGYGGTDDGVANLGRTFGLFKGGDPQVLDNWVVPRSDGFDVPNSDPSSVITSMDWSTECWVRVFFDPTFGATLIRPDLAPPPGYTGDFATQSMDPTAGWARLEYAKLPRVTTDDRFGSVFFGALNPIGSVVSIWDAVRYRVFTNTSVDYTAPQGMTLNRWNVVASNEFARDMTPEEVVVASVTHTRVSLRPCHIFADRVFAVRVGGVTIPQNLWRFNRDSQEITLISGLPSANYPVNVVFAPGRPVTNTYLAGQPFDQSQTVLNEGTPSFQQSQAGSATISTTTVSTKSGSGGRTPAFPPAVPTDPEYFLRDQYLSRQFADETEYLYEHMEFLNLEDGGARGRLASYCDGFDSGGGGGGGGGEIALSGDAFSESLVGMGAAARGRGPGVSRYGLLASGAGFNGGVLGTASFVAANGTEAPFSGTNPVTQNAEPRMLYATAPSENVTPGSDSGAVNRETLFVLRVGAPPGVVTVWTGGSQSQTWG